MINYNGRKFRLLSNTENGEVNSNTTFVYKQVGNIVTSNYDGDNIVTGHLVAIVSADGELDMRYHHINDKGELMTGICRSTPEILSNGKIRLYEQWQWTCGDYAQGSSVIEEE